MTTNVKAATAEDKKAIQALSAVFAESFVKRDVINTRCGHHNQHNVTGPDGKLPAALPVRIVFTAVRRGGKCFIQDERAHFTAGPSPA